MSGFQDIEEAITVEPRAAVGCTLGWLLYNSILWKLDKDDSWGYFKGKIDDLISSALVAIVLSFYGPSIDALKLQALGGIRWGDLIYLGTGPLAQFLYAFAKKFKFK